MFFTKLNLLVVNSTGLEGVNFWARLVINLFKWWIDPIKLFSCLNVFGCCRFLIASAFFCIRVVPYLFNTNPIHSTSLPPNLHLSNEVFTFSASIFFQKFCKFFLFCSLVPCGIIKISAKNENVSFSLLSVRSIAFWKRAYRWARRRVLGTGRFPLLYHQLCWSYTAYVLFR